MQPGHALDPIQPSLRPHAITLYVSPYFALLPRFARMSTASLSRPLRFRFPSLGWRSAVKPLDFAAKVRNRMRTDRRQLLVTLQDKLAAKQYAAELGVPSAPVIAVAEQANQLHFEQLPANCFLKATHGCGWNIARRNNQFYLYGDGKQSTTKLSDAQCRELCHQWLQQRWLPREWAYGEIPPRIIVEETLESREGNELLDYRIYAFHGVVKAIGIGSPQYRANGWNVHFNRKWTPLDDASPLVHLPPELPARPALLPQMLAAAERLTAGVDFVRVDLYETSAGIMLGEFTVYPNGGVPGTPSESPEFCQWLGEQWC